MLLCLSFDHRTSAFSLLERLAQHEPQITSACNELEPVRGSAILATCNRFEVYLDLHLPDPEDTATHDAAIQHAADLALARFAHELGLTAAELTAQATRYEDHAGAEHLIGVAAGLHSAAVGEEEIAGQVRRAHSAAQSAGTMSHTLERLFQAATRTSRDIKHRTGLRTAGRSLVDLSLRMVEGRVPSWRDCRIVLIGTGAYAGAAISALRARGAQHIEVHSPSGRAVAYAARHNLSPVPDGGLHAALTTAHLVVACSRVEEPLLKLQDLTAAPAAHQRLFLDLGLPRNIDSAACASPRDELLDLETVTKHASVAELGAEAEALQIVREAATEFAAAQAERDALPAILTFRKHVMTIMEDELCRMRSGNGGNERAAALEQEATLRRFTGRLLHEPLTRLRSLARDGKTDEASEALAMLFGLDAEDSTQQETERPLPEIELNARQSLSNVSA